MASPVHEMRGVLFLLLSCLIIVCCADGVTLSPECERCGWLATVPICTLDTSADQICRIHITDIHPTQFAVGPRQVKTTVMVGQKHLELNRFEDFLTQVYVPITIGLGKYFLTDKHHHVTGISEIRGVAKGDKWITAYITENRSGDTNEEFWIHMVENNLVWLYDVKGDGPLDPDLLPAQIPDLLFDPYRDLAYLMKAFHVIESTPTNFGEFMWANHIRKYVDFPRRTPMPPELVVWCNVRPYDSECISSEYNNVMDWTTRDSVKELVRQVCQSPDARNLPGYIGKTSQFPSRL